MHGLINTLIIASMLRPSPVVIESVSARISDDHDDIIFEVEGTTWQDPRYVFGTPNAAVEQVRRTTAPGVLGPTPDGRGVMRDLLLRDNKASVVIIPIKLTTFTGFYIPPADAVQLSSPGVSSPK